MFRLRNIVPRNTQNTQKFSSARKFCEFCGSTFQQEASVCSVNSVGGCSSSLVGALLAWLVQWRPLHPLVGCVGMAGCHTLLQLHRLGGCPKISVRICDICGRKGFCEFCGKIVWWQRGYGRMPYPPISAPPEEISLSTCLLVNLSTNKKKNYAE